MTWDGWYHDAVRIIKTALKQEKAMKDAMTYNIHGIEIRASLVHNHGVQSDVYFAHDISFPDRALLERHNVPVYFDVGTGFRYITVDTALLSRFTMDKVIQGAECECGAKAVGASRHSTWCPCTEVSEIKQYK